MVIRSNEHKAFEVQLPDGTSTGLIFEDFTNTLPSGYKSLFLFTMRPGASFAPHGHTGESELYLVLEGEVEMVDNGTSVLCKPGDLIITDEGDTHGGKNISDQDVKMLGIVIPHQTTK